MFGFIKFLWTIIRTVLSIILIAFLAIIITQRVSNNNKSIMGIRIFTVVTESMKPEYIVGDTILTRSIKPEEIKIGDDITYFGAEESFKGKIVTHRVIKIEKDIDGKYIFQTKGIANDEEDPKINETQIYGKVLYKIKTISYLNSVIGNLYGMYFAIFVPFGLIFFIEYIGYRKDKKIEREEQEDKDVIDNEKEKIKNLKEKRKQRRKKRRAKRKKE